METETLIARSTYAKMNVFFLVINVVCLCNLLYPPTLSVKISFDQISETFYLIMLVGVWVLYLATIAGGRKFDQRDKQMRDTFTISLDDML